MDLSPGEKIKDIVNESQQLEEEIFLTQIREFYTEELEKNQELYDYVAERTNNFRQFSADFIREAPRVVKILRYLVMPPISQMKFGQFCGVSSTSNYEADDTPTTPSEQTANMMTEFMEENIDQRKVPWLYGEVSEEKYLKQSREWTCDIIAQSEANTRYRNWRKDIQEEKVAKTLEKAGLTYSAFNSTLANHDDLPIGTYTSETRVRCPGDDQKADFVVRPKDTELLLFIEAKAVGVKIDSYKRVKEIRNKHSDWKSGFPDANVGAVIAGWIPASQIETLLGDGIEVWWEHRLDSLESYLQST